MFLSANAGKRSLAALAPRPGRSRGAAPARRALGRLPPEPATGPRRARPRRDAVRARNPRIVYCTVGAYGRVGPLERAGLRRADAGRRWAHLHDRRAGPAGRPRRLVADRPGTGRGPRSASSPPCSSASAPARARVVDVSLYETALAYIGYHLAGYLADGTVPPGEGTRFPMVAPYQVFRTADGELMIAGGNDRLFAAICGVLGMPDLVDDRGFRRTPTGSRTATRSASSSRSGCATEDTAALARAPHRRGVPGRAGRRRRRHRRVAADGGARNLQALPHPAIEDAPPAPFRSASTASGRSTELRRRRRRAHRRDPGRGRLRTTRRSRRSPHEGVITTHDPPLRLLQRHAEGAAPGLPGSFAALARRSATPAARSARSTSSGSSGTRRCAT